MGICWSDVVNEIFSRIEDLKISCPSCSAEDPCITQLPRDTPMDIQVLGECCTCLIECVLDPKQNVDRIYVNDDTGETVAIYILGDAVVEVTSTTSTILPITKLGDYIEMLEDMGYDNIDTVKKWLEKVSTALSCAEKP
uniref:Uncharacterized protein n=1 Tax=Ignisphaera aggregans TaxID=334771 RepID=A0A7C2VKY7_9CREN